MTAHVAVAFGLSYSIGFERQLRGGPAGDRNFSLIGTAAAALTAVAITHNAGNAIAGIVTGVGFIGAALLVRGDEGIMRGLTSAGAVLATAVVGVVAGAGYLILALITWALVLFSLEVRYLPLLWFLDARRFLGRFTGDDAPPRPRGAPPGALE